MQVQLTPNAVTDVKKDRLSSVFVPPENWRDVSFTIPPEKFFTVDDRLKLPGRSTLGNRECEIEISPHQSGSIGINPYPYGEELDCTVTYKTLRVNGVRYAEHPIALGSGLRLSAEITCSESSFPNFAQGLGPYLDLIKNHLVTLDVKNWVTVTRPVVISFPNGASFMLEPDDGSHKLVLDHQFSHEHDALGKQRTVIELTPEVFAYISRSRTLYYGTGSRAMFWMLTKGHMRLPFVALDQTNVIFIDTEKILNPNSQFNDRSINREPLMHEVVDKLAPLALLPGRFVGKITTSRTSHAQDVKAIKVCMDFLAQ